MKNEVFRAQNVTAHPNGKQVFHHLSFHVDAGETVSIMKTHDRYQMAFYDLLRGALPYEGGYCFWNGETEGRAEGGVDVVRISPHTSLIQHRTIAENMLIYKPTRQKRVWIPHRFVHQEVIRHLGGFGLRFSPQMKVAKLSGFQQYMLEIIKAHILGARLILLEGMISNLTVAQQGDLKQLMTGIKAKGTAFLLIDNVLSVHQAYADRILFMRGGCIVFSAVNTAPNAATIQDAAASILSHRLDLRQTLSLDHQERAYAVDTLQFGLPFSQTLDFFAGETLAVYDADRALDPFFDAPHGAALLPGKGGAPAVDWIDFHLERTIFTSLSVAANLGIRKLRKMSRFGFVRRDQLRLMKREFSAAYPSKMVHWRKTGVLVRHQQFAVQLFRLRLSNPDIVFFRDYQRDADYRVNDLVEQYWADFLRRGKVVCLITPTLDMPDYPVDRVLQLTKEAVIQTKTLKKRGGVE